MPVQFVEEFAVRELLTETSERTVAFRAWRRTMAVAALPPRPGQC